eukprot:scaffold264012_cov32-Tisochrysis_lutea.AAC.3
MSAAMGAIPRRAAAEAESARSVAEGSGSGRASGSVGGAAGWSEASGGRPARIDAYGAPSTDARSPAGASAGRQSSSEARCILLPPAVEASARAPP